MNANDGRRPKRSFARPLGDFLRPALDPLAARQGFGESSLLTRWPEIVGARAAALCQPVRLKWPGGGRGRNTPSQAQAPATLILRVEPGFGLDVQHMAPTLIERANAHLGWRCVAKIAIKQEPLLREESHKPRRPPPDCEARAKAEALVADMTNEPLRAALARLGENALTRRRSGEKGE